MRPATPGKLFPRQEGGDVGAETDDAVIVVIAARPGGWRRTAAWLVTCFAAWLAMRFRTGLLTCRLGARLGPRFGTRISARLWALRWPLGRRFSGGSLTPRARLPQLTSGGRCDRSLRNGG